MGIVLSFGGHSVVSRSGFRVSCLTLLRHLTVRRLQLFCSLRLHYVPCGLFFCCHSVVILLSFSGHSVVDCGNQAKAEERENSACTFFIVSLFYC
jgi:hypothetical protein